MSPFQEFFFRAWLHPRIQAGLGRWPGILATSLGFALWHFCPPLEGTTTSTLPVTTPWGFASAAALGVVMGWAYDRTDNLAAPWLGHAIAGLALVASGTVTFVHYMP